MKCDIADPKEDSFKTQHFKNAYMQRHLTLSNAEQDQVSSAKERHPKKQKMFSSQEKVL